MELAVGLGRQRHRLAARDRAQHRADADRDAEPVLVDHERIPQGRRQIGRHPAHRALAGGRARQHDELVAPETGEQVPGAPTAACHRPATAMSRRSPAKWPRCRRPC
nr:hypothetical protein [Nocardia thailandica]